MQNFILGFKNNEDHFVPATMVLYTDMQDAQSQSIYACEVFAANLEAVKEKLLTLFFRYFPVQEFLIGHLAKMAEPSIDELIHAKEGEAQDECIYFHRIVARTLPQAKMLYMAKFVTAYKTSVNA